jgi:hypothetical protein
MATSTGVRSLSVEKLLEAVDHLSPAQKREFQRRFAERQGQNGGPVSGEDALVRAARTRLAPVDERRLKRLVDRSESGRLTPKELTDYRDLAQEAQRIDALRAEALAELARRRGQSLKDVRASISREDAADDR